MHTRLAAPSNITNLGITIVHSVNDPISPSISFMHMFHFLIMDIIIVASAVVIIVFF